MQAYDVIILGGGAAGLFCACTAGKRGQRVLLLEHNNKVGKKITISGGGRCNFTNLQAAPEHYLSENPAFCRSALARYQPADFLSLVESHGIAWHEKKMGQLFCDTSSREIITMLLAEANQAGVTINYDTSIGSVTRPEKFHLETSRGKVSSNALVVATGGLSFAKLGASDLGYRLARQFGLRVTTTRPGLVPLTFGEKARPIYGPLSGVSLPVKVRHKGTEFSESLLITHRGLSGPAVLQISSYWREGEPLSFDLLPTALDLPIPGKINAPTQLSSIWPKRFSETWCAENVPDKPVSQWTARERESVRRAMHHWAPTLNGTEGHPKAEVTLGGVDTRDLSSKSMEARSVPGLYFIGEVVDVTGWLGGYNFQWAWASAHAAGTAI
jgi:hypothetical protein